MNEHKTHWKKLQNPDYLGAYALEPGQDLIATIKSVGEEKVIGSDGKKEECTVVHFAERDIKPMVLNVTNAKTISKIYKTPYIEDWHGCKIQIYVAQVKAFGDVVDALRIRPYKPDVKVSEKPVCADCGAEIQPFGKYDAKYIAERNQQHYGKPLCAVCAQKRAEKEKAENPTDPLANTAVDTPEQPVSSGEDGEMI
ncbi:hypothetical protein [Clostridium sp. KNHs216]|uniref:hypothetical protein n=1 Tax=Clostridium sp. KNHs216 TaxID=1550235 RepID=UPI00114E8372|nr:hypothetical protein [Clostridium sp. KNHs216]TQI68974.1 hypothetical protein LY85_3722 [Clostridium sp. KNHs216]